MADDIFQQTAPLYWAVGLPVIPLVPREKRPVIEGWQRYGVDTEISDELKEEWLDRNADGNIGLPLGPISNLCMIDIDSDSELVRTVLSKILPPSPWERRGRKGAMLAYRYSGFKTFRIKDAQGNMLVEGLSARTQCVLPPSIHPDTGRPYEADSNLFDPMVQAQLMALPPDIEAIIRGALEHAGIALSVSGHSRVTEWVASGNRDVAMMGVAGVWASGVLRGEKTFKEAIEALVAWHGTLVEKVAGDDIDIEKGVRRLAEFLIRDVTKSPKKKALPVGWDAGLTDAEKQAFGFEVFNDENVAWSFDDIKTYLKTQFTLHDPHSSGRREAVKYALDRIAVSGLPRLEEDALIEYITHVSQCGFTKAGLRATLAETREGGISGANQTEIARAVLEELERNGKVVHVGRFWQWNGSNYELLQSHMILKRIAENYGHLVSAKRASDHHGILTIMATLSNRPDLREVSEPGVNFANGYLTLDLKLLPHHPDFGCTYTLPYRYLPELDDERARPKFRAFLESCWRDDDDMEVKIEALREAVAVTMFGVAPRLERVFCLHGIPHTGKSQMLRLVQSLLPEDVRCAIGPESWGDRFLPAEMHGKLFNMCGELSENRFINGEKFKQIVSGEAITAQRKNQQPFVFAPTCAHWFATNHLPRTHDTSQGFNRRWLLFTYNRTIPPEEKILDLGVTIAIEEREAIVAWAMKSIIRVMERGDYTVPPSHVSLIEEVAKANNSLRAFLLDSKRILIGPQEGEPGSTRVSEIALYNEYYSSACAMGVAKPVLLNGFRQKMRELGSSLGFNIVVQTKQNGGQECFYENLILVRNVGKEAPTLKVLGTR